MLIEGRRRSVFSFIFLMKIDYSYFRIYIMERGQSLKMSMILKCENVSCIEECLYLRPREKREKMKENKIKCLFVT